ncbi:hypothetical protein QFZ75_000122 [Streptomyces sp. V3I8]|uniref:DUF6343 family protein n=1 Tax=Streptomyces sp. V3I8 TaxID=3042279 RepID=UPI0027848157|nr:DUF6343 family protein [Streptomyces sp. V3I8]MDQ1033706.1 hypothetical protein [Streptomyces sp. V3I8]
MSSKGPEEPEADRTVSRARSGPLGLRRARTGTEPATARSPLRLRLLLSAGFLPLFVAASVIFAVWAANSGTEDSPGRGVLIVLAAVCAALALVAAGDLGVVTHRLRHARRVPGPARSEGSPHG